MNGLKASSGVLPALHPGAFTGARCTALVLAIIVYAYASSPTPDHIGTAELLTGALMIFAIGVPGAASILMLPTHGMLWKKAGRALFIYGFSIPLITGVAAGHDLALIVRDLIPFLYFLLPLLVYPLLSSKPQFLLAVTGAVALAGVIFALRLLIPSFVEHGHIGFSALPDEDPQYFANAPTVLFTAILCVALAARSAMTFRPGSLGMACTFAMPALCCFLAMAAAMQRATIGLAAAALAFLWGLAFNKSPFRALVPLALVALGLLIIYEPVEGLAKQLMLKMSRVGLNNRVEEASLVFRMVQDNPLSVVFGLGWGQTVASPAVGDVTVNYTHTMFTALWLKTGLAGVTLALLYLCGIGSCLWRLIWREPVMAVALAVPCLIDVTLYASYKSLDFGLVLMLIPLWTGHAILLRRDARLG